MRPKRENESFLRKYEKYRSEEIFMNGKCLESVSPLSILRGKANSVFTIYKGYKGTLSEISRILWYFVCFKLKFHYLKKLQQNKILKRCNDFFFLLQIHNIEIP